MEIPTASRSSSMIKMSVAERVFLRMATVSFAVLVVVLLGLTIFRLRKSDDTSDTNLIR